MPVERQLGEYGARIANLEKLADQMADDIHAIRQGMDNMERHWASFRGGWKVAIAVATAIASGVSFVLTHFSNRHQ